MGAPRTAAVERPRPVPGGWRCLAVMLLLGGPAACGPSTEDGPIDTRGLLELHEHDIERIMPGGRATLLGFFAPDADIEVWIEGSVDGEGFDAPLDVGAVEPTRMEVRFPPDTVRRMPPGRFDGRIVASSTDTAPARAALDLGAPVRHRLVPRLLGVDAVAFPDTPVALEADGALEPTEGTTRLMLRGWLGTGAGGDASGRSAVELVSEPIRRAPEGGLQAGLSSRDIGIEPRLFSGDGWLVNEGPGWRESGPAMPVRLSTMPPFIEGLDEERASRGQAIVIRGMGFVAPPGRVVLKLDGRFHPEGGVSRPIREAARLLVPRRVDARTLVFTLRPRIGPDCRSDDLGAEPGRLEGVVTPIISAGGVDIEGAPFPLSFRVLPTRQVVWLRFLPAFTDALRLFGLRARSAEVRAGIVERVRAAYAGVHLDVRDREPVDFVDYTVVDIGGPDPNSQALFGLDSSPGFDRCNARLDERLAGLNAETGQFGGVFVESFLQLSARARPDHPLSDPRFDEVMDPVIEGARPGGARATSDQIDRAVRMLSSLVGQTVAHELGHALGLSVEPGCGEFHNAPGPRQLMDCGIDRPFEERAELSPASVPRFSPANRRYLEQILPLP